MNFALKNSEYYDLMYGGKLWRSDSLAETLVTSARGTLRNNVERLQALKDRGLLPKDLDPLRFSQVSWGTLPVRR